MKKILLSAVILLTGLGSVFSQNQDLTVEEKIESILQELTLSEKIKMCHAQSKFSSPGVPRLGIPEIWMSDGPHGVRQEISWDAWSSAGWTNDSCTAFPALTCLAATFDPEMSMKYGIALGEEARYRKKDIILGPGVNIYRTPVNGRNFEYMGEDPYLASVMAVPYIKGVQQNGVAACTKHYALNNQELERSSINVEVSDRALYEIYLPAFKASVVEGGVWSMMGAYNKYRGQFTTHNERLVKSILKGDWGFDGVVVSDWGSAHDTKEAALYGLDIEMGTGTDGLQYSKANAYDNYYLAIPFLEEIKKGTISEEVLDDKVRRILRLMFRTTLDTDRPLGKMTNQEHFAVAREVAQKGMVLLKNQDSYLPIDQNTTKTIAVIGENATRMMTKGGGSSELKVIHEISPLKGIKERYKSATITHAMGYASGPSQYGKEIPSKLDAKALRKEAIAVAAKADMVFYIGGLNKNHHQDCENGDRVTYNLPFGQDELLAGILEVNKNVTVVLLSGNAVAMPWLNDVKAVLQAWYPGSETGHAIADLLSGEVNPSGKLPFTFPVKLEDNGAHAFGKETYPGVNGTVNYTEDILVGYRWHDTKKIKPQFAFGHGLSYTTFGLSNAKTDRKTYKKGDAINISVEISNTGKQAGAEVIQVYAKDMKASVFRPEKELKAFKKVFLEPGQKRTVALAIKADDLAFYDENLKDWNLEAGKFKLMIGTSSDNILHAVDVTIKK